MYRIFCFFLFSASSGFANSCGYINIIYLSDLLLSYVPLITYYVTLCLSRSAFARVTDGSNACHNLSLDDKSIIEQLSCDDGATHYRKIIHECVFISLGLSNVSDEGTHFFTLSDFRQPYLFLYRHVLPYFFILQLQDPLMVSLV